MTTKRRKTARTAARAKRRLRLAASKVARARSPDAGDITSKSMLIGYARVSTVDQNLALQRDALTEAECAQIFTEQMSGAVTDRPALHDALELARSGDTLIVWKLDRLAYNRKEKWVRISPGVFMHSYVYASYLLLAAEPAYQI